MMIHIC